MSHINELTLIGEIATPMNDKYFVIAVTRPFFDKDGNAHTDFFKVNLVDTAFENTTQTLVKGKTVKVEGSLINRVYESNGEKKYVTEIVPTFVLVTN